MLREESGQHRCRWPSQQSAQRLACYGDEECRGIVPATLSRKEDSYIVLYELPDLIEGISDVVRHSRGGCARWTCGRRSRRSYLHLSDHEEDGVAEARQHANRLDEQPGNYGVGDEETKHQRRRGQCDVVVYGSKQPVTRDPPVDEQAGADDERQVGEEALLRRLKAEEVRALPGLVRRATEVARLVLVEEVVSFVLLIIEDFNVIEGEQSPHRGILSLPHRDSDCLPDCRAYRPTDPEAEAKRSTVRQVEAIQDLDRGHGVAVQVDETVFPVIVDEPSSVAAV